MPSTLRVRILFIVTLSCLYAYVYAYWPVPLEEKGDKWWWWTVYAPMHTYTLLLYLNFAPRFFRASLNEKLEKAIRHVCGVSHIQERALERCMAAQTTNLNYCAFFMASAFVSYEPLSTLPRERCIEFYYIDTSVLLENIPLVKFIKTTSGTRVVYFP